MVAGLAGVTVTHSEAPGEGHPSPASLLLPLMSHSCHSSERDALGMFALFSLSSLERAFGTLFVSSSCEFGWFHLSGGRYVIANVVFTLSIARVT